MPQYSKMYELLHDYLLFRFHSTAEVLIYIPVISRFGDENYDYFQLINYFQSIFLEHT